MGGVATGPGERVVFPGVLVILNQGPSTPPSTGGTVGTVVNHIGFTVPNVQEAVAKWKAAGVPFEPGAPGRLDQGWVTTTDGLKIEIQEDKDQKEPIRSKHVHFFLPENAIAESQAWYGKTFGAKASVRNNAPVSDIPGVQLRWNKVAVAEGPTKGRVLDHIGFDVTDLKAFIAKLEAAGIKLDADGAYRVNDVGVGIAFITDPWGTRIELNERPKAVYLP
jgi:catechol 2,3-dioxygenase-like lactoylglutathione lyase family enzyme